MVGTIPILLLVLFGIEIMLMYLLPLLLPVGNPLLENLADAGLLTILFTPVLYRFIFRPFREIADVQNSLAETIMAQLVDGVVVLDGKLAIRSLNGAAERMFGYAGSEAAGKGIGEVLGNALEGLGEPGQAPLPPWPGESVREVEAIRCDGSRLAVELSVSPLRLGGEWLWLAMVRDVSARKQDHLRLKETLSLLGATIEATADGIIVKDLKGKLVICNRRFAEMWRLPPHLLETGNDQLMRAFVAEQLKEPGEFLELTEKEYLGTERETRDWLSFKDGRIFERYSSPQVVDDRIVGRVICFKDLTEQRHLELQLRHAQKMEALGALAGGVAHDFNNILTVIMGFCTITASALEEQSPLRRNLEQIMAASERALTLTASLLTYSRKQPMHLKPVELNGRVRQTERFLARLIGAGIELVTTLCPEQLTVLADGGQLEQVLMNLATNARDAMAGKGCLAIETRRIEIEEEFVRLHGYGQPGTFALLTVSDTGAGMEQAVRE
ncbi:PAS domain S-box protein, partial [Geomonas sp.]|uniref:PAS domain S-box protein n=1 Tax=Geomonas sp. TaxID=2651584 RepID=UPI002B46D61D